MALDVKVKIELSKPVGSVGFGIPLLLECGAETPIDYFECYALEDITGKGLTTESEIYKAASMLFAQENRPEKIAICITEDDYATALPKLVSKDWRQLVLVGAETTVFVTVADYIETTDNKMLFLSMKAEDFKTFKTTIASKKYKRTVILVNSTAYASAALVGETAGRDAGSFTYKFKTLKNVTAETYSDAEIEEIHEAGGIVYVTKVGDDITSEGISQDKTFIDQTDAIDYVIQSIQYNIQKVFHNTAKVPFDNRGISLLESAVTSALQNAGNKGIIATKEDGTYDYTVSFAARSATTEADRASRHYKYGTFTFALAGAIHSCVVEGEVTY